MQAYALGELTIASYATLGTLEVLTGGILGVVGLGISVAWIAYEVSTDDKDPPFPLAQFGAVNNLYGISTFAVSLGIGVSPANSLNSAQLASDVRSILQLYKGAGLEAFNYDIKSTKEVLSATNALVRQSKSPAWKKKNLKVSDGPGNEMAPIYKQ